MAGRRLPVEEGAGHRRPDWTEEGEEEEDRTQKEERGGSGQQGVGP